MTIRKEAEENGMLELSLEGRLDTTTSKELETALQNVSPDVSTLILNFNKLNYISSAGLRVLLCTQKQMNAKHGKFILRNVCESIMEVFELTGFDSFLTIES